ncbi:Neuronal cell adhesion molecule [Nibea albiflora]|uniref:Neuronal cell adhesion molecule n=1 Tax=Nibea albiflora TaxID=240163 RepID=A0ACB7FEA8_NIBAL|nr:Neuronal cell adhesion molecule [Nibea albiflora]
MMEWRRTDVALLVLLLGHLATALEVPLDLPQPPTITHQSPKDYIIDPRENIIIHCEAKGKPHPSFSWTRNGTHFDIDEDPNVTMRPHTGTLEVDISRAKAEHYECVYQCTARNKHGTAVSNNIVVQQSRSPLWSKEKIKPIVVQEGVSLVLPCRPPAGLPPPIIFWMDNYFQRLPQSSRVSQSLNGDLYFSNVLREDSRNDYICYARFPYTQTIQQKQPITVKVLNMDAINDTMAAFYNDTDLFSGELWRPLVFTPPHHPPYPNLELQNLLAFYPLTPTQPDNPRLFHNLSDSLFFPSNLWFQDGAERTGAGDGVHCRRTVSERIRLSFTVLKASSVHLLKCHHHSLSPSPSPPLSRFDSRPTPEVSWTKVSGDLPAKRTSFLHYQRTLRIVNVSESDAGDYRCTARNQLGSVHHTIHVMVKAAPYWISGAPRNLVLAPGENGVLTCRANGIPKPSITWTMNGESIENSPKDVSRKVEDDTIIFTDVQTGSSAVYQCNVSNDYGYLLSNAFVNVLSEPPRVLTPPNKVYQVIKNHRALIDCASFGSPIPKIEWYKDSRSSILEGEPYIFHDNGTLEIPIAQAQNSAKYTCVARNKFGIGENHIYLEVKEPTRILTLPEYKVVQSGTSVVFECKVKHDPSLIPTMIWYKDDGELPDDDPRFIIKSDSLTITDVTENDAGDYRCLRNTTLDHVSATATLTVVGFLIQYEDLLHHRGHWHNLTEVPGSKTTAHLKLSPYVHYTFRVLALNVLNWSRPSAPSKVFRTEAAAPDDNPTGVRGFGTEHNNLVISWKPLTGHQSNGPGLRYKVMWRQNVEGAEWMTETVANGTKFVVSGTPTFFPYELKVQAVNDHGEGPEPAGVLGYSGEDLPVAAPENVHSIVRNSTLVEVHWDPVPSKLIRGHLKGFKVYYWREHEHDHHKNNNNHPKQILTFSGNHSHGMLPGLHPYSRYSFNVRVYNGKGEGPHSPTLKFVTPEGVPGPPTSLTVTDTDIDSLTLEWSPPHVHNGRITSYTLKYQPVNNSNELGPVEELALPANETSVTLSNLKYNTRYKFYLNAKTFTGAGPAISQEAATIVDEVSVVSLPASLVSVSCVVRPLPLLRVVHRKHPNFSSHCMAFFSPSTPQGYCCEGEEEWQKELVNGSQNIMLKGLKGGSSYRVRLVAKGHHDQPLHLSEEVLVTVPAVVSRQVDIATQGWFIGLMCAIALLILILLIICFIQRNKGGKYPVKEKEDAHTDPEFQPMKDDDCTFGEYSDNEDHKPLKGSRTPSNGTVKRDDSDDSLVDYGEGGDGQFNEDGSFIGQYSGKSASRDTAEGHESSEAPSPINAMNSLNSFV